MTKTTKAQRRALKRIFDRGPVYPVNCIGGFSQVAGEEGIPAVPLTYKQFRRRAFTAFADDVVMIPWAGMILGIERDGYIHS